MAIAAPPERGAPVADDGTAGPPPAPEQRRSEVRRRPRTLTPADAAVIAGSAVAALAVVWLVFTQLTSLQGDLGFGLCWYLTFVAIYGIVVLETEDRLAASDRVAMVVIGTAALALLVPLVLIVGYVIQRGLPNLRLSFFTETQQFVGPLSEADEGGAAHAIVGTLQQVGIAVLLAVPLGLATAVYLNEVKGRLVRPVRLVIDAMSGLPSIVAGLFVFAVWVIELGNGFSGVAGALALAVLMLPTVTRTAEVVLRLVPDGLREASLALGAPEWRTTWGVVLPTARSGLVTAVILGVARAIGETAPLILTIFGASVMNANPLDGEQDSLPLFVYRLIRQPQDTQIARAWTGALVLIALVLFLFVLARIVGGNRSLSSGRRLPSIVRRRTPR